MPPPSSSRAMITTLSAASGPGSATSFMSQASAPTVASAPSNTKVKSPLKLDRPIRRGLRGGRDGGGAGSFSAGLRARPNRLTRGRGAAPSPESWSPLMSVAASSPSPMMLPFKSPRGAASLTRAWAELSRPGAAGKHQIALEPLRSVQRAEDERGVRAAEAEGIGQRRLNRPLARCMRHEIDRRLDRRVVEIESRRARSGRGSREWRRSPPPRPLRRADGRSTTWSRTSTSCAAASPSRRSTAAQFDLVADRGRGAVRIDVVDLRRRRSPRA